MNPGVLVERTIITHELQFRNKRAPNLQAECEALHSIANVLTSPTNALELLAEIGLRLCYAESSGICLLQRDANGNKTIKIHKIFGKLKHAEGAVMPACECPCGITIETGSPQLFLHPEEAFPPLVGLNPAIEEAFSFPIQAAGRNVGTIWVISHSADRGFDSEDARIMSSLSRFAGAVLSNHFNHLCGELGELSSDPETDFLDLSYAASAFREPSDLQKGAVAEGHA